jgi:hypothetical protein
MSNHASNEWSVHVEGSGPSGSVLYHENAGCISFYWEFGGRDTVVIIHVDDQAAWSTRHPWATERRREILQRVASEIVRQKAPTCRADIDEQHGYIYVREHAA